MPVPAVDQAAWSQAIDFIKDMYGITLRPDGTPPTGPFQITNPPKDTPNLSLSDALAAPPLLPGVSTGFKFQPEAEDSISFRYYHVELLLQEVISLLERALTDRAAYQRIGGEFLRYRFQIEEFIWLDAIHGLERPDVYKVPHEEALGELNAETTLKQYDDNAAARAAAVYNIWQNHHDTVVNLEACAAWNSLCPPATKDLRTFDPALEQFR